MEKTGRLKLPLWFPALLLLSSVSAMGGIQAGVDRTEVPLDESVSLKISASPDEGGNFSPKFDAPDFEIMNQFQNSKFSSVYINGKFENKSELSITYILRPLKIGALRIRNISNNGQNAPDITIQVIQENLYKKPAPGEAPSLNGDTRNFFVRAELSKSKAFKGEQIIVSYYLYRRTRANIRDVMQYPSFQGFIREDLEMPILSNRPDFEAVNLGGIPFERALLARYAVYPIKEGRLKIDGFSVRVDYIPKNEAADDLMEDPFFQFFSQVAPRTGTSKSDPITIEVSPLPEEGRGPRFTGGVGDFEIDTQMESGPIRANSPLTIRYSVKGRGNTSLIEFPKVDWPSGLKFYQSQGKTKNLGQGQQEKTFEVVLVPTAKGDITIPAVEFEFFNPESRSYQRKSSQPISIHVEEGEPGTNPSNPTALASGPLDSAGTDFSAASETRSYGNVRERDKQLETTNRMLGIPLWRWVSWFGLFVFAGFLSLVFWDQAKKRSRLQLELLKRKESADSRWRELEKELLRVEFTNSNDRAYSPILERAKDELYKTLDEAYGISARALSSRDLAKTLTETFGVSPDVCRSITRFLEFTELIRFSSGAAIQPEGEAERLTREWLSNLPKICSDLARNPLEKKL
ncbi:MAG: BatD family protein [Bdellovibrionales bacterium]|nr:BatD family protein [Bdellovibrionales bacterium]